MKMGRREFPVERDPERDDGGGRGYKSSVERVADGWQRTGNQRGFRLGMLRLPQHYSGLPTSVGSDKRCMFHHSAFRNVWPEINRQNRILAHRAIDREGAKPYTYLNWLSLPQ